MHNIQFFKDSAILLHSHPDLEFLDCVSLTFERQNRQDKNDTVTHEATGNLVLCPIRFAAGLVRCMGSYLGTSSNTNVSAYMSNGSVNHVMSLQVINALCNTVSAIREARLGIAKHEIGTHSIRLGAAMAMYLGECLVYTIMLISRWSSNVFLWYIR